MTEGWREFRLGELATKIGSGATPKGGKKAYKSNGIRLIRSLNVHNGSFREKNLACIDESQAARLSNVEVQEGDVLLNITGASIARCCVVPSDFLPARVNQHVSIIRPRSELVDSRFLSFLLVAKEYKDRLLSEGEKAGATRQALTKAQLQSFKVVVPALAEQKRIVAILDEAFAAIATASANAEKSLANARELFKCILDRKTTATLAGWREQELQQDIRFIDYRGRTPRKTEEGMRLITAKNVKMGVVNLEPREFVDHEIYDDWMTRGIPIEGDVLFTTEAPLGNVAQLDTDEKVVFAQRLITLQPNRDVIDPKMLHFVLRSSIVQRRIQDNATGATAVGIKASLLKKIMIPLPTDINVQLSLAAELKEAEEKCGRLADYQQEKLAVLAELKQSILHKAFTGELTSSSRKVAV